MSNTQESAHSRGPLAGLRHRFRPTFVVWLTLMWIVLMGEISIGNVIAGLLVALAVVLLLPLPAMPVGTLDISWGKLAKFFFDWFVNLIRGSLRVGWLALRPQEPPKHAIVEVPMRVDSELVLAFAVMLYNLQPGGTVTDIDIANRRLTVHLLEATTEADLNREIGELEQMEHRLIEIFERRVN